MSYKATIKMHLPTDPPWRDSPADTTNTDKSDNPEELWRKIILDITARLGFAQDINVFTGIILNLINPFPEEFRQAIVKGVNAGYSLQLEKDENGVLVGHVSQAFPPLAADEPEPALTMPDGAMAKRTASGLIIPV